jgi:hypothetical protein
LSPRGSDFFTMDLAERWLRLHTDNIASPSPTGPAGLRTGRAEMGFAARLGKNSPHRPLTRHPSEGWGPRVHGTSG